MDLHSPGGFLLVVLAVLAALLLSPWLAKITGSKGLV
jgi:hypothetical protein